MSYILSYIIDENDLIRIIIQLFEYRENKPGHLTTMSDVYSYGVVLLELLTGRRCMDKKRPKKEQSLVGWARPLLKDPRKMEGIMDPRLDGQYSIEGSKIAAMLAYQCLSKHPKTRPTMSAVIKILEPLLDLNDMSFGCPFVYVARKQGQVISNNKEEQVLCSDVKNEDKINEKEFGVALKGDVEQEKVSTRENDEEKNRNRNRHQKRSRSSRAVMSDSALYQAQ